MDVWKNIALYQTVVGIENIEGERILNNLVEKELEQIKKEISQIDDYFREGIVNSRKIQMSRDIKRYQKTYFFPCEDNY